LTKVTADPEHPNGCICVKGTAAPEIVYAPDRLQYPMVRTRPKGDPDPGWTRISWDEALDLTASRLLEIKARYGPEAVVFPVATPTGTASNDFHFWAWRLANAFGSPNVVANTHICQWHRDHGSKYTYGVSTPPPDYEHTRCMLLWGFNPQASWPAAAMQISRARAQGARIIVIDPRKTGIAEKADLWLRVRPGADGALALSMIHVLLEERLCDEPFVRDWTNGAFLVREDTAQMLTGQGLAPTGDPQSFLAWDGRGGGPVAYRADGGYGQDGIEPALSGTYTVSLASVGSLAIMNRTQAKADDLVQKVRCVAPACAVETKAVFDPAGFDVVINATSLGHGAGQGPLPSEVSRVSETAIVAEVVLVPEYTPFLQAAQARGLDIVRGIEMFTPQIEIVADFLGMTASASAASGGKA
jgi:anaerobic selenocysteine-containing dehydrogenase